MLPSGSKFSEGKASARPKMHFVTSGLGTSSGPNETRALSPEKAGAKERQITKKPAAKNRSACLISNSLALSQHI